MVVPHVPWPEHEFTTLQLAPEMHALLHTHCPLPPRVPPPSHEPPAVHAWQALQLAP